MFTIMSKQLGSTRVLLPLLWRSIHTFAAEFACMFVRPECTLHMQVGMVPKESRVVVIQTHAEHRGSSAKAAKRKPNLPDVSETPKRQHRQIARAVSFAVPNAISDSSEDEMRSLGGFFESQPEPGKSQKDWLQPQNSYLLSPAQSQVPLLGTQPYQAWSLQPQAEPLLSPELAQLSPSQSFASFSGRLQSKSLPSTAASASQNVTVQGEDDLLQSTAEVAGEGLSFALDSGDTFEDGDTLRAFNTISQVCPMLYMLCCFTCIPAVTVDRDDHFT